MNLTAIYEIAATISSAAVFGSLIFVGLQVRQNTLATRAASHHAVSEALNALNMLWAGDAEVSRIWLAGLAARQALTAQERWRFDSTLRTYLHVCETMYTQADLGAGDLGIVLAEEEGIRSVFSSDGVRDWWAENPYGFSDPFRQYIGTLVGTGPSRGRVERHRARPHSSHRRSSRAGDVERPPF